MERLILVFSQILRRLQSRVFARERAPRRLHVFGATVALATTVRWLALVGHGFGLGPLPESINGFGLGPLPYTVTVYIYVNCPD